MQARPLSHPYSLFNNATKCLVTLGLLCLAGCGSLQEKPRLPEIPLLPPAALGQHVQLTQSVTLQINPDSDAQKQQIALLEGQPPTLLAVWSVDKQGLNLVGLTPTGQTIMTLQYDGEDFSETYSPLLFLSNADAIKNIPGREILAQLQLCYWPLQIIEQHLKNSPWRLITTEQGRALYLDMRQILEIRLPQTMLAPAGTATSNNRPDDLNEVIEITNIIMGNHLNITTLSRAVLP